MERNVAKYVEEYEEKYIKSGSSKGNFYVNDFTQVFQMAEEKIGQKTGGEFLFWVATYAMELGFMVGYKLAKSEARKKKKA